MNDPAKEIPFQGVYRFSNEGTLTLLTNELSRPNGIAFSPDEKILYIANSDPKKAIWMAFDVANDGSISNGRIFFDATDLVGKEKGLLLARSQIFIPSFPQEIKRFPVASNAQLYTKSLCPFRVRTL